MLPRPEECPGCLESRRRFHQRGKGRWMRRRGRGDRGYGGHRLRLGVRLISCWRGRTRRCCCLAEGRDRRRFESQRKWGSWSDLVRYGDGHIQTVKNDVHTLLATLNGPSISLSVRSEGVLEPSQGWIGRSNRRTVFSFTSSMKSG